ncbi:hypothetical protein SDC9_139182 [bioreactor metagenome]|uniref:Uncharacterized protein n=1 Tax=bioreactor metagenome TaxID=1076179 RepID=A0A645DSF0_9ZZZZ
MRFVISQQTIRVFAHAEEVGLLFHQLDFMAAWSNPADDFSVGIAVYFSQLCFREELFVGNGIPAFVFAKIDVALCQ